MQRVKNVVSVVKGEYQEETNLSERKIHLSTLPSPSHAQIITPEARLKCVLEG